MLKNMRKIAIPTLIAVPTLVILSFYILETSKLDEQIVNKDKEIVNLGEKLAILDEIITNSDTTQEQPKEELEKPSEEHTQEDLNFPFINLVPEGIFEDEEKEQLQEKLIEPFIDFYNDGENLYIAIIIEKLQGADDEGDFKYDVQTLDRYGHYGGFLYGGGDDLEWWLPDCLDGCEFTEDFEKKYPEIVESYQD